MHPFPVVGHSYCALKEPIKNNYDCQNYKAVLVEFVVIPQPTSLNVIHVTYVIIIIIIYRFQVCYMIKERTVSVNIPSCIMIVGGL